MNSPLELDIERSSVDGVGSRSRDSDGDGRSVTGRVLGEASGIGWSSLMGDGMWMARKVPPPEVFDLPDAPLRSPRGPTEMVDCFLGRPRGFFVFDGCEVT